MSDVSHITLTFAAVDFNEDGSGGGGGGGLPYMGYIGTCRGIGYGF